jgi:hypothetical protein
MGYVVTLQDFTPGAREDATPWTQARIDEATTSAGPWATIDTQPLVPLDVDPSLPAPRSLTTVLATLPEGWYRVVFLDAAGNQQLTVPVHRTSIQTPPWRPTLEQVAQITPAYTRGGFDDDEPQAGSEQGTFTATTSPTAAHVEGLIVAACDEVAGRVGIVIPERCHELAGITARWHVAAAISAGKIPAGTDDASGEYRSHISNFRACLDELVVQARDRTIVPG